MIIYAIGTDITTGEVEIRNYANGTAIKVAKSDIAGVVQMLREEYPECEFCEGTRVDGYCTDCGRDADGRIEAAEPGEHDHADSCVFCGAGDGSCCEHCPGNHTYDQAAIQTALEEIQP